MEIRTERLRILQLDLLDLELCSKENGKEEFERKNGLNSSGKATKEEIKFDNYFYQAALKDPSNAMWFMLIQIVLIEENKVIGGLCFKGGPDENGEVEIGYGLDSESYWNKGYMTEAVRSIVKWALEQEGVSAITASTNKDNFASQKVLKKINMIKYRETEKLFWWKVTAELLNEGYVSNN